MNHTSFLRHLILACLAISLFTLLGCGGGGGNASVPPTLPTPTPTPSPTPQNIAVTVAPPAGFTGFIGITQALQFTAAVTGTTNQGVTWAVKGVPGGNATVGTVSSSGLYTAPNQIPNPQQVSVTATSQADTTKSASVPVFISRIPPMGSWVRTGPPGGTITSLAEDVSNPGTAYAGTNGALDGNGGVWKTTDAGGHWVPLVTNTVLDNAPSYDIDVPASGGGKVIYVSIGDFVSSEDGGATWSEVATPAAGLAMAVDPENRSVIYTSAPGKGVLKSHDGGTTWTLLASSPVITAGSLIARLHNPLTVDPSRSTTVYYGTDHGLFISRDGGVTWSASSTGITASDTVVFDVAGDPVDTSEVFALIGPSGSTTMNLYETTDHGNSWTPLASGLDAQRVVPDPTTATTLYLYGFENHAAYKSTDGGHTFTPSDTGLPSGAASNDLSLNGTLIPLSKVPNTFLLAIGGLGVCRSQDGAGSWSLASDGISAWFGVVVAFDPAVPTTLYFGAGNFGGIWKSTDSGVTWVNLRRDEPHAIAVDPFDSTHLLAATFDEGLIVSHDGGTTWQAVTNLPPPPSGSATLSGITFHPNQNGAILISAEGGGVGVLKSTDGGSSWTIANSGLTTDRAISAVAVNPQTPSMLFLGTANGVFKSTDLGNSWSLKTATVTPLISIDAKVSPPALYINGAKSTDLGETWSAIPNAGIMVADPSSPNSVFTVTASFVSSVPSTAQWSPDGGTTWFPLNTGLGRPNLALGFAGGADNGIAGLRLS